MDHPEGDRGEHLHDEIAIRDRVERVGGHAIEPELARGRLAIERVAGPGQRTGSERRDIDPDARIGQAGPIAFGHLDICQQVMREQDRLGRLDVGRAGQDRGPLAFGKVDQRALECEQCEIEVVDRPTRPEAQVRRDLVVARAPGVESSRQRPDLLDEGRLNVHVDVLEGGVPFERPGRRVAREGQQAVGQAADLVIGQEARPTESSDVRDRTRDVVGGEGGVDLDRAGEVRHARIRVAAEPPAPGPHRPSVVMAQCYPPAWPATGGSARCGRGMRGRAARRQCGARRMARAATADAA